eukprot:TRINITY_DN113963_c0_g1_i1.p1 TRINITY_DN113963_c0_g1~~TRINITY_DN113963_c0_g1_i1.p1  ORF type:complete len:396 (-),score=114.59 TRINITY_DN113963_c0_g1_i1:273-1460(-)
MTNYSKWDKKAADLVKEAEEEEEKAKAESDKALGISDGPKGPPTAKAEQQMKELGDHSKQRKDFIDWSNKREVQVTHGKQEDVISLSGAEYKGKAIRLTGSEDVKYVVPSDAGLIKLMVDKCKRVHIDVHGTLLTSSMEMYQCEAVTVVLAEPLGTAQVDECITDVRICYPELDHVGRLYHQNSPGLTIGWEGEHGAFHSVGRPGAAQWVTGVDPSKKRAEQDILITAPVRRGEGEFPLDLDGKPLLQTAGGTLPEPDAEAAPAAEDRKRKAEEKRLKGNDMFRASDFMQAAMEYTSALEFDPEFTTVLANRSQCWLKLGDHDKALADAVKVTELDPANAKGWFRKGMSLHAMKRYQEAIPALCEAEKLDPKNKQIPEAIKMAQMMARKQAQAGY